MSNHGAKQTIATDLHPFPPSAIEPPPA